MTLWSDLGFGQNPYTVEPLRATEEGERLLVGREDELRELSLLVTSSATHPTIEGDNGAGVVSDDPLFPETTAAERDRILAGARAEGSKSLPCERCGSEAPPLIRQPRRLSLSWWEDPSPYVGCADCGAYLADLPVASPFVWETEVPEDLEIDPNGSEANPRELD